METRTQELPPGDVHFDRNALFKTETDVNESGLRNKYKNFCVAMYTSVERYSDFAETCCFLLQGSIRTILEDSKLCKKDSNNYKTTRDQ